MARRPKLGTIALLYSFAGLVLDTQRRELRRENTVIPVEPQVFDLVELLVRQRHRVVTRNEIIESVWGGRVVSESTLASRINAARRALGDDGSRQAVIKTISRRGLRFVADASHEGPDLPGPPARHAIPEQQVRFCRTADNVNIAVAAAGAGKPLIKTANWLNHLEFDWQSPVWSPFFARLASRFRFIRYDGRGNGLADRNILDIDFDGFLRDLETVIEASGEERFALFGMSQGAATAISYAARNPERVSCLILYGAYALGRNKRQDPADREKAQTLLAMMRQGWGEEGSAFMRAFSSIYLPNATPEQIRWFADLQRKATSGDVAARLRTACDDIDVTDRLPDISVPTLVLHAIRDNVVPFEQGRAIATAIPGAGFVSLDSENHIPLPEEPAWETLLSAIEDFVATH